MKPLTMTMPTGLCGTRPSICCNDATTLSARQDLVSAPHDWAIELSRAGLAAMLLVALFDFLIGGSHEPVPPAVRLLKNADLAAIGITLSLTWHTVFRHHRQIFNLALCLILVMSETAISLCTGDIVAFAVAAILVSAGTVALMHWVPWRQIAAAYAGDTEAKIELRAALDGAEAASRAKSDFVSQMSHEIRSPMNAILGMADLLNDTDLSPEQHKYLSIMMNNGAALLDLIDDILDFARIESGRLKLEAIDFDLIEITEQITETLAIRAHQKGLEFALRVAPGVPTALVGDPLRLRQVLINLIANAIKFTGRGEVTLAIDPATDGETAELHFAVSDTGIGIADDQRAKIFSRFMQASPAISREYGGAGLGLAIVKQLVELMGGRIWLESELGRGSTFHFIVRFEVQAQAGLTGARMAPEIAGTRVLIADHTASTRLALAATLGNCGAHVTQMENGECALIELRRADQEGTPYRIVLLDCRIPAADSLDLVRRVCEAAHGAGGTVIPMLTSNDLNLRLPLLRRIGLVHHVIKPVRRSELFGVIRALMGLGTVAARPAHDAAIASGIEPPTIAVAAPLQASPDAGEAIDRGVNITSIEPVEQIGEARRPVQPAPIGRPLRILVADDSADNRLLIRAFLKQTSCHVEQAENGEIALEKFVAGSYDVVLMDIQMPVMDGYTAAKLIRQWEQDHNVVRTPIIALTASVLDEAVHKSFDAGCDTHVSKPVRRPTLLAAIHEVTAKPQSEEPVAPEPAADEVQAHARAICDSAAHSSETAAVLPTRVARMAEMN